jgi:hypothetical protein
MARANSQNKRSPKENSNRADGGSKKTSGRDSHKGNVKPVNKGSMMKKEKV